MISIRENPNVCVDKLDLLAEQKGSTSDRLSFGRAWRYYLLRASTLHVMLSGVSITRNLNGHRFTINGYRSFSTIHVYDRMPVIYNDSLLLLCSMIVFSWSFPWSLNYGFVINPLKYYFDDRRTLNNSFSRSVQDWFLTIFCLGRCMILCHSRLTVVGRIIFTTVQSSWCNDISCRSLKYIFLDRTVGLLVQFFCYCWLSMLTEKLFRKIWTIVFNVHYLHNCQLGNFIGSVLFSRTNVGR